MMYVDEILDYIQEGKLPEGYGEEEFTVLSTYGLLEDRQIQGFLIISEERYTEIIDQYSISYVRADEFTKEEIIDDFKISSNILASWIDQGLPYRKHQGQVTYQRKSLLRLFMDDHKIYYLLKTKNNPDIIQKYRLDIVNKHYKRFV